MTDDNKKKPFGDRKPRPGKPFDGEKRGKPGFGKPGQGRSGKPFARGKDRPDEQAGEAPQGERIAKRLARAGVSSRREAEALIADGRISVNGRVLHSPAFNVMPSDKVAIDGKPIPDVERTRLWLFHKPAGLVTTNRDPEGRKTVFDALPEGMPRVITIGRLDINTEGLLLLTNDGGLARILELPATGWLRRYRVRVHGKVDQAQLDELKNGIAVDGVFYGSMEAVLDREQGANAWLTISLREGKNREVKNVMGALGLDVTRLIRISYGPFQLADLPEGGVREIRGRALREQLGERLIEESGANFDAPILNEFTNSVVVKDKEPRESGEDRRGWKPDAQERREDALGRLDTRPARPRPEPGEGGLIKRARRDDRRSDRDDRRSDRDGPRDASRDRPRDGKPGFKKSGPPRDRARSNEERSEANRVPLGQERRGANVWMAPGARPEGEKARARRSAAGDEKRSYGKPQDGERDGRRFGNEDGGARRFNRAPRPERDGEERGERKPRRNEGGKTFDNRGDKPYGKGPRDDRGDRKPGNRPGGKPYGKGPRDGTRSGPRDGNRPGPRGAGPKGPRGPKRGDR